MDVAAIEEMISQRVAIVVANYHTDRQEGLGHVNNSSYNESRGNSWVCSYKDFSNYKPKNFYGDGGVIKLTRYIEKTKSLFEIRSCVNECKVKFDARTFMDSTLSRWKGHVKTMGLTTTNVMSWEELKVMMMEEYYPRSKMQGLE